MKRIVNPMNRRIWRIGIKTASSLATACLVWPLTGLGADPLVVDIVHVNVASTELESVDVTKDGSFIAGGAPLIMPELGNEAEAYHSQAPLLLHDPAAPNPFTALPTIQLGPGEVTDIVISPDQSFMVGCVRDDDLHARNQLLLIPKRAATQRVNLPDSADGIGLSPNGRYVVVAGEKYEAIDIYEVVPQDCGKPMGLELAARIGREAFAPFFAGEEARLADEDLEPESVSFNPDGSLAFVSLQEQSSVAVIDMATLALVNVVHLPFGFLIDVSDTGDGSEFGVYGVEPDGMSVTLDGNFLIVANEADSDSPHLQGISIVDLRNGPLAVPTPATYSIFDLDPTLLNASGVASCPVIPPGVAPTLDETAEIRALPRLDPNNTESVVRQGKLVTAVNIERKPKDQDRGSVLFLDSSALSSGGPPVAIVRVPVGVNKNARPEALKSSNDGRFIWVGLQNDGGTIARIELAD